MNAAPVCRTCLCKEATKTIFELQCLEKAHTCPEVVSFCLNIQVEQDTKVSTKLCLKCFSKIMSFYEFKLLALKNDAYLRTLELNSEVKDEDLLENIKKEKDLLNGNASDTTSSHDNDIDSTVIHENNNDSFISDDIKLELKDDNGSDYCNSDEELLSVIKQIKYETNPLENSKECKENAEESKENEPYKPRRVKKLKKPKLSDKTKQICAECGKRVRNLKTHSLQHQPKTDESQRKRVPCKLCDKTFSSHSARYKHNKNKHLGIKKCCPICNKNVANLRQHNLVIHNAESLRFACAACGRRFISQSARDVHASVHTDERPHACDLCHLAYRTKVAMMQHRRRVHENEKTHLCQFCSKSFFKKYHLQVHLRSHTKEKPYACDECGKSFSSTTNLKNHRMTHSAKKAFACTHCDMSFVRPGYLSAHMLTHIKDKKYPCKYCGVKFHRSDHRKRHQFTAHERHLLSTT